MNYDGNVIVVTGATDGIGKAYVEEVSYTCYVKVQLECNDMSTPLSWPLWE